MYMMMLTLVVWWRWRWWWWWRKKVLNAGRREKVWIFQGTSGDHMDCSRPPENGSQCAMPCLPLSARSTNTLCNLKKYILWIEKIHFTNWTNAFFYIAPPKRCNSCVLGGRAFPLCAESPHPAPCQSRSAGLTNTFQNFEQILLLNIRQNLPCTRPMTCSLSCFICRLDIACKITHPWWLRRAKIY